MWRKGEKLTAKKLNGRLQRSMLPNKELITIRFLEEEDQPENEEGVTYEGDSLYSEKGQYFVYASYLDLSVALPEAPGIIKVFLPGLAGLSGNVLPERKVTGIAEWNSLLHRWDLVLGPLVDPRRGEGPECSNQPWIPGYHWRFYGSTLYNKDGTAYCGGWAVPCYSKLAQIAAKFDTNLIIPKTSTYPSVDTTLPGEWLAPSWPYTWDGQLINSPPLLLEYEGVVSGQNQWATKWADAGYTDWGEWIAREDDDWGIVFSWGDLYFSLPSQSMESVMLAPLRLNPRLTPVPLSADGIPFWLHSCRGMRTAPYFTADVLELTAEFSYSGGAWQEATVSLSSDQIEALVLISFGGISASIPYYTFALNVSFNDDDDDVFCQCFRFSPDDKSEDLSLRAADLFEWLFIGVSELELIDWEGVSVRVSSS